MVPSEEAGHKRNEFIAVNFKELYDFIKFSKIKIKTKKENLGQNLGQSIIDKMHAELQNFKHRKELMTKPTQALHRK